MIGGTDESDVGSLSSMAVDSTVSNKNVSKNNKVSYTTFSKANMYLAFDLATNHVNTL